MQAYEDSVRGFVAEQQTEEAPATVQDDKAAAAAETDSSDRDIREQEDTAHSSDREQDTLRRSLEGGPDEDEADSTEFSCCVCTDLLLRPCTLICGHTCCMHCLSQWMALSTTVVKVCPQCRNPLAVTRVEEVRVNVQMEAMVQRCYPEQSRLRAKEHEEIIEALNLNRRNNVQEAAALAAALRDEASFQFPVPPELRHSQEATRVRLRRSRAQRGEGGFPHNILTRAVASCVTKTVTAPFQRSMILMQTEALFPVSSPYTDHGGRFQGVLDCMRRQVELHGFSSLWRGNVAFMMSHVPSVAMRHLTHEAMVLLVHRTMITVEHYSMQPAGVSRQAAAYFRAAVTSLLSAVLGALVSYPLSTIHVSLAVDSNLYTQHSHIPSQQALSLSTVGILSRSKLGVFVGPVVWLLSPTLRCFMALAHAPSRLYRGFWLAIPGMLAQRFAYTVLNGLALRLVAFLNRLMARPRRGAAAAAGEGERGSEADTAPTSGQRFVVAQMAVLLASVLAHPFGTIRHALQVQPGLTTREVIEIVGWRGLFTGVAANVLRLLGSGVLLLSYDLLASRRVRHIPGHQQPAQL